MACERKLGLGREDPQADVRIAVRRIDEDGLRERHLAGQALQVAFGDPPCVREHCELVARQRPVRKDVTDDIAEDPHRATTLPGWIGPYRRFYSLSARGFR